jgi:acyl-CoA dehydrogenase
MQAAPPKSPFYTGEHEAFRATIRRFVEREIAPFADEWDEAGEFPRALYRKAAAVGILGLGYPEEFGGTPTDPFYAIVLSQELARAGAGGIVASLLSHTIGLPPIARSGSPEMKARVVPQVLSGEKISALAITEPDGGSDVASLGTTARREGDCYRVNGGKMFITSGMRADFYTVAVRTGGAGTGGISLLLIERGTPGFTQAPLKKMGWWASDTAALHFDDCRVPAENLIGEENGGFRSIMLNFNGERIGMAAGCNGFSMVCLEEAARWARQRIVFGRPLIEQQVIRHKLVDMAMRINATQAYLEALAWRVQHGQVPVADIAMLKNQATQTMAFCASEAVQIHGGMGFMRGTKVERIYREVKVNAIGGGTEEIMKELAARQMGW